MYYKPEDQSNSVDEHQIDRMLDRARKSISRFCIEECGAYCCRKGFLILSENESDLVMNGSRLILQKEESFKSLDNSKYSLNFSNSLGGCPSLLGTSCIIHKNKDRPNTCKNFPIFRHNKTVIISKRCPASKQNMFYKCEHILIKNGYLLK